MKENYPVNYRIVVPLALFFLMLLRSAYGQEEYIIKLSVEAIEIPNRRFYVETVGDARTDGESLGLVKHGTEDKEYQALFEENLSIALKTFFDMALEKRPEQVPVRISVNRLVISEQENGINEFGFTDLSVGFYLKEKKIFNCVKHVEAVGLDVTRLHEENIRNAFRDAFLEFNMTFWAEPVADNDAFIKSQTFLIESDSVTEPPNQIKIARQDTSDAAGSPTYTEEKRNITTLGYQVGGYTLIGIEYELRAGDYVGFRFGGGISGFGLGIKFHTNPKRNSPFVSLTYKDGGFGLIKAMAVEAGSRIVFTPTSKIGINWELGLARLYYVDETIEEKLFKGRDVPPVMLSLGIGLSW